MQGVLALVDQTDENMGGFQCIPELYKTYETWKLTQPEDRNHFKPDTTGFTPTKVKMEAGDLMIFNSSQPHGIRPNNSDKVRVAQYISMIPADENNEELRQCRINAWHDRLAPQDDAYPGDPSQRNATILLLFYQNAEKGYWDWKNGRKRLKNITSSGNFLSNCYWFF